MSFETLYKKCFNLNQTCQMKVMFMKDNKTKMLLDNFVSLCTSYELDYLLDKNYSKDAEDNLTKHKNHMLKHVNFKSNPSYYVFLHCYDACIACGKFLQREQKAKERREQWVWVRNN